MHWSCFLQRSVNSNSSEYLKMGRIIRYFAIIIIGVLGFMGSTQAQLQLDFYSKSCPRAETIIRDFVNKHIHNAPSLAAALIRMHFHDCFVRVCVLFVLVKFFIPLCFSPELRLLLHLLLYSLFLWHKKFMFYAFFRVVMDPCFWTQRRATQLKRMVVQI